MFSPKRIPVVLLTILLFGNSHVFAQGRMGCGTEVFHAQRGDVIDYHLRDTIQDGGSWSREAPPEMGGTYLIPVVFHIIHDGGEENIPFATILNQMAALNDDMGIAKFGGNVPSITGESDIRFCLASVDPQGRPTNGVVRVQSGLTRLRRSSEASLKALSRWDPRSYMNVYIVRDIDGKNEVVGYATLPQFTANDELDGIVLNYHIVGKNVSTNFSSLRQGHSLAHEVGHYLSLLHTWGGSDNSCSDDDGVDDTPPALGQFFSDFDPISRQCEKPVECGSTRQVENYMDYSDDQCYQYFTRGQIARMRSAVREYRGGSYANPNQVLTGCDSINITFNPIGESHFEIAPNPAHDYITLYPRLTQKSDVTLSLVDALGHITFEIILQNVEREPVKIFLGSGSGVYIMRLEYGGKVETHKVVVF